MEESGVRRLESGGRPWGTEGEGTGAAEDLVRSPESGGWSPEEDLGGTDGEGTGAAMERKGPVTEPQHSEPLKQRARNSVSGLRTPVSQTEKLSPHEQLLPARGLLNSNPVFMSSLFQSTWVPLRKR